MDLKPIPGGFRVLNDGSVVERMRSYERYFMIKDGYPCDTKKEAREYIDEVWDRIKGNPSLEDRFAEAMNE